MTVVNILQLANVLSLSGDEEFHATILMLKIMEMELSDKLKHHMHDTEHRLEVIVGLLKSNHAGQANVLDGVGSVDGVAVETRRLEMQGLHGHETNKDVLDAVIHR